jgi:ribokinase
MPARLCIIGSITIDLVARAPRLPRPGETVLGSSFASFEGGKGANQAVAAARMGAEVTLVGAVGNDDHGARILAALAAEGLDLKHIARRDGVPTGVSLIGIDDAGENAIIATSGANMTLSPADVDAARAAIAAADLLLMQLEVPMATVQHAARIAQEVGTTLLLNAAPGMAVPAELLAAADVLVVNESEADLITRDRPGRTGHMSISRTTSLDAAEAMQRSWPEDDETTSALIGSLVDLRVRSAILTLGPQGCAWIHENSCAMIDAFEVNAIDTVGAGDAFCAALAVRLAENQIARGGDEGIIDALHWASAAGALATTKPGAIPSLPTREEVKNLLRRL